MKYCWRKLKERYPENDLCHSGVTISVFHVTLGSQVLTLSTCKNLELHAHHLELNCTLTITLVI